MEMVIKDDDGEVIEQFDKESIEAAETVFRTAQENASKVHDHHTAEMAGDLYAMFNRALDKDERN